MGATPNRSLEELERARAWSAQLFAPTVIPLLKKLREEGHDVVVGRTVVWVDRKFKAYPHYKGLSKEYLTLVDFDTGKELGTFHWRQAKDIEPCVRSILSR